MYEWPEAASVLDSKKPKPWRLPERHNVTIAIGLCGKDGLVLATDSQQTVSGYIKGHRRKLATFIYGDCVLSFAGAGTSDYIDTAIEKASHTDRIGKLDTLSDVKTSVENSLLEFFDTHLARWASFANELPSVELLVGISTKKDGYGLFHYSGTAFHQVQGAKAIGAGILFANSLIAEYSSVFYTIDELTPIAVSILSKVKKNIDTCGGYTDLIAMRGDADVGFSTSSGVEKIEAELHDIERECHKQLEEKIIGKRLAIVWLSSVRESAKEKNENCEQCD